LKKISKTKRVLRTKIRNRRKKPLMTSNKIVKKRLGIKNRRLAAEEKKDFKGKKIGMNWL
tara:strand:- start:434 stop:613 length:180 start_codon:yes stop_codon:yes gene_type:complete